MRLLKKDLSITFVQRGMNNKTTLALSLILLGFVIHAVSLDFTQDDAYITYRYVRNLVNGHGLVFNPGERVEGYTNFLWIMLLSIFAGFRLDMVVASKVIGVLSGCVAILLVHRISHLLLADPKIAAADTDRRTQSYVSFLALCPAVLLASNGAFAYWSISGLETSFFVLAVLASVYLYMTNPRLMVVSAAVASLIRPEGVLVFGILLAHKAAVRRDGLKSCLVFAVSFVALLLPFAVFKIIYYGALLPNPFYAKTGFSAEYFRTGIAYFWRFLRAYALWGILYVIPFALIRHLDRRASVIGLLAYGYTCYVILVGGDVLRGHRFFLPVIPLLYVLLVNALLVLFIRFNNRVLMRTVVVCIVLAFTGVTFVLPLKALRDDRRYEIGLVAKLSRYAARLRRSFGTDYTLATTTVGVISYLTEARVIDMLGLTDSYIARNPEHIPGIASTWKEKRFNTQYVLSRDPDVIMFSTGLKPSAPAEKALFLSSKFRENYYIYFFADTGGQVYKKKGPYTGEDEIFTDPRFIDIYIEALYLGAVNGQFRECLQRLDRMRDIGPKDFARTYEYTGSCHFVLGEYERAREYAQKAIALDDYSIEAHKVLHDIYVAEGDVAAARSERAKILLYNPEAVKTKQP